MTTPGVQASTSRFGVWDGENFRGNVLLAASTQAQNAHQGVAEGRATSARNDMVDRLWCGVNDGPCYDKTQIRITEAASVRSFGNKNNVADWFYGRRSGCDN